MYAIMTDGSHQYRVEKGSTITVDYRDVEVGAPIEFTEVLLLRDDTETLIGQPRVVGARVIGEVVGLPRKKTVIQKFHRRKNYRRLKGHTQPFVQVKIAHILRAGESVPSASPSGASADAGASSAGNTPSPS